MNIDDIIPLAFMYEEQFALNLYKGNLMAKMPFSIILGAVPVLISIPHSVMIMRNTVLKAPELYTGALGYLLHSLSDCSVIVSTRFSNNGSN